MLFTRPFLTTQSAKTSSFTAKVGEYYPINLASVTADIAVTFPSSPPTNSLFGFYVSAAHSSGGTSSFLQRPFFCVEPANTTSINGASYSAKSGDGGNELSLWLIGDSVTFLYTGSTWQLISLFQTKHKCTAIRSTNYTTTTSTPVDVPWSTTSVDNANLWRNSGSTQYIQVKRGNKDYIGSAEVAWANNNTNSRIIKLITTSGIEQQDRSTANAFTEKGLCRTFTPSAGNDLYLNAEQNSGGNLDLLSGFTELTLQEV